MKIHVWGARGSLPVPGPSTVEYGGNTSCVEVILSDGYRIILDSGTGIRNLGKQIIKEGTPREFHIFLTHAHWDHISGFPFFQPLFTPGYTIHFRGGPIAKETVQEYFVSAMKQPFFPMNQRRVEAQLEFTRGIPAVQQVGSAEVHPIPLNHPNGGFGFKIIDKGDTFVYMPDNELEGREYPDGESYYEYVQHFKNADLLFHDAQYTPEEFASRKGWGHSSLITAMDIAMTAGVKRLGLFHHDPDRTDDQIDRLGKVADAYVERKESKMSVFPVREGMEIRL
jgi:phosphoribosyl 1,2-cyclic phosphodiesterase